MNSFLFSLNATIPVFALIIFGQFFKRLGLINEAFASSANKLVFKVCLPCLVFQDLADTNLRENFDITYVGFCFFATLISILLIWGLARHFLTDSSEVGAFVQGAYRSSAAILGIAFIQNIYGTSGMAPLMIIGSVPLYNIFAVIVLSIEGNSAECQKNSEKLKTTLRNIVTNPIIIGIVLGLLASLVNLRLPQILDKTINNLAVITSPLALLSIGASFQGKKALSKITPTLIASFIKLIGLAALFLPLAIYLGFQDQKLIAIVIMLASPCTPSAYIMAKNMGGDDVLTASIIVSTTLFSAVTLTFWIFLLKWLALIQ